MYNLVITPHQNEAPQTGKPALKLHHSMGVSKDSSSVFASIITVTMTLSTLPQVIFVIYTETGILPHVTTYSTGLGFLGF